MTKIEEPSPSSSGFVGYLDHINDGHVHGWACNQNSLNERVTVNIYCEEKLVGQGLANFFRQDLLTAGVGDGKYSFRIPLSYELKNGEQYLLKAFGSKDLKELFGSPIQYKYTAPTKNFDLIKRAEGLFKLAEFIDEMKEQGQIKKKEIYLKVFDLGSMLQETGKLEDARFAWTSLNKNIGESALLHCKLGESYLLEARHSEALAHYLKAAEEDLRFVYAHIGIGNCHRLMKNYFEAQSAYESSLALSPNNTIAKVRLNDIKKINESTTANAVKESEFKGLTDLLIPNKNKKQLEEKYDHHRIQPQQNASIAGYALNVKLFKDELAALRVKVEKMASAKKKPVLSKKAD